MDKEIEALLIPNQRATTFLQTTAILGCTIVVGIGLVCLLTRQFINPFSAISFATAGSTALWQIQNRDRMNLWKHIVSLILIGVTICIGTLANSTFLFIGVALIFSQFPHKRYFSRIAQILILLVAAMSMFANIGYVYHALSLSAIISFAPMPLSLSVTFTILCIALLSAISNHGYIKILTKNSPSSRLALRLIFTTLTLPAILGYGVLMGQQFHLFDESTAVALLVIVIMLLFSILVWINSRQLQKQELENLIIKSELEKENITLKVNAEQLAKKALELEEKKGESYEVLMAGSLRQGLEKPNMGD
ncbi:MAG TPA: hypothetical protein VEW42_01030 [Candidatus Eisenbacteria bacterium]|nr:hypothetical protein [Candidatus Eisenbacteria bacterium]